MKYPEPIGEGVMTTFEAAMILDGCWEMTSYEQSAENYVAACQLLIDSGLAWKLQGRVGRACKDMIDQGMCSMPQPTEN
jgi:hypothetical protein